MSPNRDPIGTPFESKNAKIVGPPINPWTSDSELITFCYFLYPRDIISITSLLFCHFFIDFHSSKLTNLQYLPYETHVFAYSEGTHVHHFCITFASFWGPPSISFLQYLPSNIAILHVFQKDMNICICCCFSLLKTNRFAIPSMQNLCFCIFEMHTFELFLDHFCFFLGTPNISF